MTTKNDMITAIQASADASGDNNIRISMGAPGNHLKNTIGETEPTAQAWQPEPKTWPVVIEGLALWADTQGVGQVGTIKAKLNELIGAYNQLRTDYNAGVVPTSAPAVTPIP